MEQQQEPWIFWTLLHVTYLCPQGLCRPSCIRITYYCHMSGSSKIHIISFEYISFDDRVFLCMPDFMARWVRQYPVHVRQLSSNGK